MTRIIVVTSGKGGVGKTTVTANLGMALATMGYQVALVDADFELRNLDLLLGLEKRIVFTLFDVLAGDCRLEQALVKDKRQPNLALLPVAHKRAAESVSPEQMKLLLNKLAEKYEYVFIDSPAGIELGFQNAIAPATEAIVVATPELSSVRDADRVIRLLEAENIPSIQLIINRIKHTMVRDNNMMSVEDVQDLLGIPLLGVIPDDDRVIVSTNRGEPLVLTTHKSGATVALNKIAQTLQENTVKASMGLDASNAKAWAQVSTLNL